MLSWVAIGPYTKGFMTPKFKYSYSNFDYDPAIMSKFGIFSGMLRFWHYLVIIFHIEVTQFLLDLEYECDGLTSKYVQFKYFINWLAT